MEPLGMTVVFCGGAAALYLCLRGRSLPEILHPTNVERHPNPIEQQIPYQDPANQNMAGHGTAGSDPNQADPNELAATDANVRPAQDQTMADGSIQGEASNDDTNTPNNAKARNGAGRGKPNAQQPKSGRGKGKGKGGVSKPKAKKSADRRTPIMTRGKRELRELQG